MTIALMDFSGALADTRAAHAAAWRAAVNEVAPGGALAAELLRIGPDALRHLPGLDAEIGAAARAILLDLVEDGAVRLRPGAGRFLAEAMTGGLPVIVLAPSGWDEVEAVIITRFGPDMLGWLARCRSAIPDHATDPAQAIAELGARPGEVVHFGADDKRAARARAAGAFAVQLPYPDAPFAACGDLVISDFGLPQLPFRVHHGNAGRHRWVSPAALADWLAARHSVAA